MSGALFYWAKQMATKQLENLGWKLLDEGRDEYGRYCVLAESCGHFIITFADTRTEAWRAACSMAMKVTASAPGPESLCPTAGNRRQTPFI